jgi:hypothetical protein
VTLTMAILFVLTIQFAVLLAAVPHFLAVLVYLQPVFQLLGAALFLGGRVTFFLLLMQRLKLTFKSLIAGPWRFVPIRHAGPPMARWRLPAVSTLARGLVSPHHPIWTNLRGRHRTRRARNHLNRVMLAHHDGCEDGNAWPARTRPPDHHERLAQWTMS